MVILQKRIQAPLTEKKEKREIQRWMKFMKFSSMKFKPKWVFKSRNVFKKASKQWCMVQNVFLI